MLAERLGPSQLAEMSAQAASMAGTLRTGDLPRLAALVGRAGGASGRDLDVSVRFGAGPEGLPVLRLHVGGEIPLICQRCLALVSWPLDLDVALTAVGSYDVADQLADPFDSVVLDADGGLPLRAAIEDEILAALPLAPLHADGQGCSVAAGESPVQSRPFAGLAQLMRRDADDSDNE